MTCKCLVTDITRIRSFSCMRSHMSLQVGSSKKRLFTYLTFVWSFSSVRSCMTLQVDSLNKCLFTYLTFVWSFSCMLPHVCPQVRRCVESQAAFSAWIRFFSTMNVNVPLHKCISVYDPFPTYLALLLAIDDNWRFTTIRQLRDTIIHFSLFWIKAWMNIIQMPLKFVWALQ